ncbi:dihydrofolate reductase [Candidatus Parcubacteria bacterium]|nr:MAG: dihydrofolate reductase [Candidatus Parcubacteria bacterium]
MPAQFPACVSLIAAVDARGVIGSDGKLPWHLPSDLAHFRHTTMGHPVIMGRRTYESIGRPLPGRTNIVLTRRHDYRPKGCATAPSIAAALRLAAQKDSDEVFIIGGGKVFRDALPFSQRVYLTRIHAEFSGDVYFPELSPGEWREVAREEGVVDARNLYPHTFLIYERVAHAGKEEYN